MIRRAVGGALLVVLIVAPTLPAVAKPARPVKPPAVQRLCFGLPATIADHRGEIYGTPGDDVIIGDAGPNTIYAGGGTDRVCGAAGDDEIEYNWHEEDGAGQFFADGGLGDDDIYDEGSTGAVLRGGPGDDWLTASRWSAVVPATINGGPGDDYIYGTDYADTLRGDDGADKIYGHDGADVISGGRGADTLYGEDGYDSIDGGTSKTKRKRGKKAKTDIDVCYPGRDGAQMVNCERKM